MALSRQLIAQEEGPPNFLEFVWTGCCDHVSRDSSSSSSWIPSLNFPQEFGSLPEKLFNIAGVTVLPELRRARTRAHPERP